MQTNIIELIGNSCGCSQTEAQEYLDSEVKYLRELQEVGDLRGEDLFSEHTLSGGLEERIPPPGIGAPPGQGW